MASKNPTGLALLLVYGGIVLLMPPLVWIFNKDVLVFGIPLPVLYVFGVWLALIAGAIVFARTPPRDGR